VLNFYFSYLQQHKTSALIYSVCIPWENKTAFCTKKWNKELQDKYLPISVYCTLHD